jgi:hypothetical protein
MELFENGKRCGRVEAQMESRLQKDASQEVGYIRVGGAMPPGCCVKALSTLSKAQTFNGQHAAIRKIDGSLRVCVAFTPRCKSYVRQFDRATRASYHNACY